MSNDPAARDPYAVWRHHDYRLFSASWLMFAMASQVEMVAVGMHIYARTADPLSLAWIGLVRALPTMLLAIAGGHLADRFNRRKILLCTFSLGAAASAGLLALACWNAPVRWFYAFLFLGAVGQALGSPARAALLPQLIPPAIFNTAMAWNSSIFQVSTMIGPVLGGLLLGRGDYTPPAFALVLLLRVGGIVPIALLRARPVVEKAVAVTLQSLLAGIRFVWDSKIILATITLDLVAVLVGGVTYLLPVFATDILHVGGRGLGLLRAAEAFGAILMAMVIAHSRPFPRAGRAMLWGVGGFGVATVLFGLSPWFGVSLAGMFLIGACDNISVVVRHTLVQMLTPDHMRGRVSAVNNIFIGSSQISNEMPVTMPGDSIQISFDNDTSGLIDISAFKNTSLGKR